MRFSKKSAQSFINFHVNYVIYKKFFHEFTICSVRLHIAHRTFSTFLFFSKHAVQRKILSIYKQQNASVGYTDDALCSS